MAATNPAKMTAAQMREALRELRDFQAQRNSFLQQLKAQPRSPRHGRNRIPSPQTHRDPAQRAGARDDRAATLTPGGITYISLTDWANYLASTYPRTNPVEPAPIPYAGVRVGEIIGYRAWWVVHPPITIDPEDPAFYEKPKPRLRSLASDFLWPPGEIVQGDTGKVVKEWFRVLDFAMQQIWGGVYAFRSPELDKDTQYRIAAIQIGWGDGRIIAIGTCTLWGDVVEHEHGYRASHARLRSIDAVYGAADLAELRREYGLEEQQ